MKTRRALVLLTWLISRLMIDLLGEQPLVCDEVQVSRGVKRGCESSATGRSLSPPEKGKPSSIQYEWRARLCQMGRDTCVPLDAEGCRLVASLLSHGLPCRRLLLVTCIQASCWMGPLVFLFSCCPNPFSFFPALRQLFSEPSL